MAKTLIEDLVKVLNLHSREGYSNTPDYILAQYLNGCLVTYECATKARDDHYGVLITPEMTATRVQKAVLVNPHLDERLRAMFSAQAVCTADDLARYRRKQPLVGPIRMHEVFAWEPDKENAAELTVITRLEHMGTHEGKVWSRLISGELAVFNDESRFREACVRTVLGCMVA